jgi:predicted Zn-dependent peptidase
VENAESGRLYRLKISFTCLPEQVTALKDATFAIIAALKRSGVSEEVLIPLRARRYELMQRELASSTFWLNELATSYLEGREPQPLAKRRELLSDITSQSLQAAARRYLRQDRSLDAVWSPASN